MARRNSIHRRGKQAQALTLGASMALATFAGSCVQEEEPEECISTEDYFKSEVWAPLMSQTCINCHNPTGAAKESEFVLQSADWPGYNEANLATVSRLAKLKYEGEPWLIAKPSEMVEHGGGEQLKKGTDNYEKFVELVKLIEDPVECDDDGEAEDFFEGVALLDDVSALRKATLIIAGRLPTPAEEQTVRDGGLDAIDKVLDQVMKEDAFDKWVIEVFNDQFLTDRYYRNTDAVDLLDTEDYPDANWFGDDDTMGYYANRAVAREALQLVAHVIRNDKPFTEILTADYMVVNPFSAQTYGANVSFDDSYDQDEWRETKLKGIPHAGVLTSSIWLNRFPTTDTNRNRHRSRMIFKFFLGTDILTLGQRPIDPTKIQEFNPTRESPDCVVCHANMDPVAGALANWDDQGRYRPPEGGWYPEMFHPGFGDAELPGGDASKGVSWLADQIVEDPRFTTATVQLVYTALTGQAPLKEPTNPVAPDYLGALKAQEVQAEMFAEIGAAFAEGDQNFKVVIKEMVRSPYFRASHFEGEELDELRYHELQHLVTARLLTPEMLERKIRAVTGYPWQRYYDSDNYLLDFNEYRVFYGGIDSDSITERITSPNGVMANVADRMSNEIGCWGTARDFTAAAANRHLFPYVEPSFEPEDSNGFEIPAVTESIRKNIQYLHARLLGEYLEADDAEIDRTYSLFLEVWRDGKKGLAAGDYESQLDYSCQANQEFWSGQDLADSEALRSDPHYTIRAWMAVLSYLLSDYRFLHDY